MHVVSGSHDTPDFTTVKGFNHFRGFLFEFVLKNQETKECQARFNFFPLTGLRGLFGH
jgi:hypothetical protein